MMSEPAFRRLRALVLSRIEGDTDPWAREVRALLQGPPETDLFPSAPPYSAPVAREEFPATLRTADAAPLHGISCGVPWDCPPDRF